MYSFWGRLCIQLKIPSIRMRSAVFPVRFIKHQTIGKAKLKTCSDTFLPNTTDRASIWIQQLANAIKIALTDVPLVNYATGESVSSSSVHSELVPTSIIRTSCAQSSRFVIVKVVGIIEMVRAEQPGNIGRLTIGRSLSTI